MQRIRKALNTPERFMLALLLVVLLPSLVLAWAIRPKDLATSGGDSLTEGEYLKVGTGGRTFSSAALAGGGDMAKADYDVDANTKIDANKIDDLSATYQAADATLTDIADGTINEDLVNTAHPWSVNEGGTGAATLTDGGILLGSGTGAITALGVASNGQIPIGDGTTDPVLANITETGDALVVTNGAGTITLSVHANLEALADAGSVSFASGSTEFLSGATPTYVNTITSDAQAQLDARCLESVFGTAIGTGLLLDGTTLKVSAILQEYHGANPTDPALAFLSGTTPEYVNTLTSDAQAQITAKATKGTFTNGKWCSSDGTVVNCTEDAPAGSGDVTGVGDCADGACLDGSSDGGTYIRLYDGNSHYTQIGVGDSIANLSFKFPTAQASGDTEVVLMNAAGQMWTTSELGGISITGGTANNWAFWDSDGKLNDGGSITSGASEFLASGVTPTYVNTLTSDAQAQITARQAADADLTTWAGITPNASAQLYIASGTTSPRLNGAPDFQSGTSGHALVSQGAGVVPIWAAIAGTGDMTKAVYDVDSDNKVDVLKLDLEAATISGVTLDWTSGVTLPRLVTATSDIQAQINGKQATVTEGSLTDSVIVSADIKDGEITGSDLSSAIAITSTGAQDFGGAAGFEIPNGADPTVNATGEIAIDTTSTQLVAYNGSAVVVLSGVTKELEFIISGVTNTDDYFKKVVDGGWTLKRVDAIIDGVDESGATVTLQWQECSSAGASCVGSHAGLDVQAAGENIIGTAYTTTFTDATIDNMDYLKLELSSGVTPANLTVTLQYWINRE